MHLELESECEPEMCNKSVVGLLIQGTNAKPTLTLTSDGLFESLESRISSHFV